ncbi:MAG: hypothetical protein R3F60_22785 [bacterium]
MRDAAGLPSTPADWSLLPPGDAALTRRVRAEGDHWIMEEKRGRKVFSRGTWAPTERIERIQRMLERSAPSPPTASVWPGSCAARQGPGGLRRAIPS